MVLNPVYLPKTQPQKFVVVSVVPLCNATRSKKCKSRLGRQYICKMTEPTPVDRPAGRCAWRYITSERRFRELDFSQFRPGRHIQADSNLFKCWQLSISYVRHIVKLSLMLLRARMRYYNGRYGQQ